MATLQDEADLGPADDAPLSGSKRRTFSIGNLLGRRSKPSSALINARDNTQEEFFLAPEEIKQYRVARLQGQDHGTPTEALLELSFEGVAVKSMDGEHTIATYEYTRIPEFKSSELLRVFEFSFKTPSGAEELVCFQSNEPEQIRIMASSFVRSVARARAEKRA